MEILIGPTKAGLVALVDDDDEALVNSYNWTRLTTRRSTYARTNLWKVGEGYQGQLLMYRLVMGFVSGDPGVDHINGNGLDNRKENLRPATNSQNHGNTRTDCSNNTSGFKGVYPRENGTWSSQITAEGRRIHLGTFATAIQAAQVYNEAALHHFGQFARVNDLP